MQHPSSNRRLFGFSLVELLVVIAIISALTALMLPALSNARERARQVLCAGQLRTMGTAWFVYEQDYKQLPMGRFNDARNHLQTESVDALREHYAVAAKVSICPSSSAFPAAGSTWNAPGVRGGKTTYYYLGGFGGAGTGSATLYYGTRNTGWGKNQFESLADGFGPILTTLRKDLPNAPSLNDQFMMSDVADQLPMSSNYLPVLPNHMGRADAINPAGTNVLTADGRASWHALSNGLGGQSWIYWVTAGSAASEIWWTPGFIPPTSVTYMP